jgi:hypothetical protein
MQRRVEERRSVPIKTRGVVSRRVERAGSVQRKTAGTNGRRRCVGARCYGHPGCPKTRHPGMPRRIKGEGGDDVRQRRSGIAVRWHRAAQARRGERALKGPQTSREASGRRVESIEPLHSCGARCDRRNPTGPAVPSRHAVPRTSSDSPTTREAVACRCAQARRRRKTPLADA